MKPEKLSQEQKEKSQLENSFYSNGLSEEQKKEIDRKVAAREVLTQYEVYTLIYDTEEEIQEQMLIDEEGKKKNEGKVEIIEIE